MAKKKSPVNPLTGTSEPNTYTNVTNRTLSDPVDVDPLNLSKYQVRRRAQAQKEAEAYDNAREGRKLPDVPGYGSVDMDEVGWDRSLGLTEEGSRFLFGPKKPDTVQDGPAINEPHEAESHTPVIRRAEDLTGAEYQKGVDTLALAGTSPARFTRSIRDSIERANMRATLAGTTKMAGEGFYGGDTMPNRQVGEAASYVLDHPLGRGLNIRDARAAAVLATSITSPNAKTEMNVSGGGKRYPNHEGAMVAIQAGLEGETPAPTGIPSVYDSNIRKAADRVSTITRSGGQMYEFLNRAKTKAFAGAHLDASSPDSFRVSDVHSTRTGAPQASFGKASKFVVVNPDGEPYHPPTLKGTPSKNPLTHAFHPDDVVGGAPKPAVAKKRLTEEGLAGYSYEQKRDKKGKPDQGMSPVEELLNKDLPAYAIMDRSGREVAADLGWTPSVDHSQASHQVQEIDWRDQQILRPDSPQTMETEYPGWRQKMGFPQPGKGTFDQPGEEDSLADYLEQNGSVSRAVEFAKGASK